MAEHNMHVRRGAQLRACCMQSRCRTGVGSGLGSAVPHSASHRRLEGKLLSLPWQPPKVKRVHWPCSSLKAQRGMAARHGPVTIG